MAKGVIIKGSDGLQAQLSKLAHLSWFHVITRANTIPLHFWTAVLQGSKVGEKCLSFFFFFHKFHHFPFPKQVTLCAHRLCIYSFNTPTNKDTLLILLI